MAIFKNQISGNKRIALWVGPVVAFIITLAFYFIGSAIFKITPGEFPAWAIPFAK